MRTISEKVNWSSFDWTEPPENIGFVITKETLDKIRVCQALIKVETMSEARIAIEATFTDDKGVSSDWYGDTYLVVFESGIYVYSESSRHKEDQIESNFIGNEKLFLD